MTIQENNKRLAKNTFYLYIRTFIVMFISLYTSRVVLKVLGETDLGIYNLVGGIVSLMAFLQNSQVLATSRFITYELGLNVSNERLSKIYSLCMSIHILLALIIFFIAETIGLWIVNEYTNIPDNRMNIANIVYQFSILTFIVRFLRSPMDAVLVANENMSIYACFSVIETVLKLLLTYIILFLSYDRLAFYSILIFFLTIFMFILLYLNHRKRYSSYKFQFVIDKIESKRILLFSGWSLLGSFSNTLTQQGVSLLFNNYVGLVANTAMGFTTQVHAAVASFVSSFTTAFNPQIIKYEANKNKDALYSLMCRASKFSFSLAYLIALPLIVNMNYILHLWLGTVPQYTVGFCQLILVCSIIDATTGVFNTAIMSTGKIKRYQLCISLSFILDFVCAYLLLVFKYEPVLVFASRILTRGLINMLIGFHYAKTLIKFPLYNYIYKVLFPILMVLLFTVPFSILNIGSDFINFLLNCTVCVAVTSISVVFFIMNSYERDKIFRFLKSKIYG